MGFEAMINHTLRRAGVTRGKKAAAPRVGCEERPRRLRGESAPGWVPAAAVWGRTLGGPSPVLGSGSEYGACPSGSWVQAFLGCLGS